jgi:hypothetical protein
MTALRTDARWHAVVQYRTGMETPMNVEIYLERSATFTTTSNVDRIGTQSRLSKSDASITLRATT